MKSLMNGTNEVSAERGALASFLIVGVLLAGLLMGGLYLAKARGNTDGAVPQDIAKIGNDEKKDENKDQNGAPATETTRVGEQSQSANPQGAAPQQQQPQQNQQQQGQTQSATTTAAPSATTAAAPETAPRTGATDTAETAGVIPATGVEELMITTLGVTALTYYGVMYLQSRRQLNR